MRFRPLPAPDTRQHTERASEFGKPFGSAMRAWAKQGRQRPQVQMSGDAPSRGSFARCAIGEAGPLIQISGPYPGKHGLHTKRSFQAKVFIWRNICPLVQLARAGRLSLAEFMARDNWLFLISIAWILALLSTFVLILIT